MMAWQQTWLPGHWAWCGNFFLQHDPTAFVQNAVVAGAVAQIPAMVSW